MTHVLNQEVDVTSFYFTKGKTFPRRVEFGNSQLVFLESGLRCLVKTGQSLVEVFNMSDGRDYYTLRHDQGRGNWVLLNKRALV